MIKETFQVNCTIPYFCLADNYCLFNLKFISIYVSKYFCLFLHWGKFIDHMIFLLRLVYKELHDSTLLWITTTLEFQFRGVLCISINLYVNIYFLWCLSFTYLPFRANLLMRSMEILCTMPWPIHSPLPSLAPV